jgi:hypothetical protein
VNPYQPGTSTTDTAILKWLPAGGTALTAGVVLSAHTVLHVPPLTSTILAVALVRREGVIATLGALFGVLTAVYGIIYIPVKREPPSAFTTALADITKAMGFPVTADTETAEPAPAAVTPEPAVALSPLPPARSAASMEAEPVLRQLVLDQPVTGRHARAETTEITVRADGDEGQLRRAA